MKKRIVLSAMVALLVLTAMPVVAQQNGQTLMIGGLVPLTLDLTLTADPLAQNLPLVGTPDPAFEQSIAEIGITTNNTAGWQLFVYSTNGSDLVSASNDRIRYTIRYTGSGGNDIGNAEEIPGGSTGLMIGESTGDGTNPAVLSELGESLFIQYDQDDHPAGYYSDQLAVVLRAR